MKSLLSFRPITICVVALAGTLAVSSGCASGPDAKGTVDSMSSFGNEVAKVKDAIDNAVRALEGVVNSSGADLKANFETYTKSVKALDEQSKVVQKHADDMKAKGDEFFKEWETSKTVTPERRSELAASYAKIKEDMVLAKEKFTPYLASLKDIDSYLSLDLTLKGVNSMTDLVRKAKDNGAQVKARIDSVLVQLNSVRGMLSTAK
jgi:hypothetical protein